MPSHTAQPDLGLAEAFTEPSVYRELIELRAAVTAEGVRIGHHAHDRLLTLALGLVADDVLRADSVAELRGLLDRAEENAQAKRCTRTRAAIRAVRAELPYYEARVRLLQDAGEAVAGKGDGGDD